MCDQKEREPSLCAIVPPYVTENIALRGSEEQRTRALRTLAVDGTLRALRAVRALTPPALRRIPPIVAGDPQVDRTISDAKNTQTLPGTVVRSEGDPATGDPAVDEAYDGLGATFDLYLQAYQRDSIDDEGLRLDGTVHFGQDYNNAFWNGERMVFGDGDGELFNRFTISIDVIGHELTHGVTEDEAQLRYLYQSGALNESISDVFGSLVKQRSLGQKADDADWLIGAGLFTENVNGVALRSMKAPGTAYDDPVLGKDPQPAHMDDYVNTVEDNGGVHINSGIPNRAFYLAAVAIGGHAWEKAGRIWYETLRDPRLRSTSGFRRFAQLSLVNAGRLFGLGSSELEAVRHGWDQVGISVTT